MGRIAAIRNDAHNEFWKDRVGFFGFFDAENDPRVAGALLDAASRWLEERGMDRMRGPASPSTNHECGLLVEGFDEDNVLMMPYNSAYYEALLTGWGLEREMDLYAYKIPSTADPDPSLVRLARRVESSGKVEIRNVDLGRFRQELETIRGIYNDAWEANWGFIPVSGSEFDAIAKELKPIVRPELCYIAFVEGESAAFSIGLPNLNELLKGTRGRLVLSLWRILTRTKSVRSMRVITLGVKKKFQNRGIPSVFYMRTMMDCHRLGIDWGEASWILETNTLMNRSLEKMGATRTKTYRIYGAPLPRTK